MSDPVLREQMTQLVMRAKELDTERAKLTKEHPVWERRVELARDKGMTDLAREAAERRDQIGARLRKIEADLEIIDEEKRQLRYQARRPSGREVERAQAMVERVREGGLIDVDEATLERELAELDGPVSFDFDDQTTTDDEGGKP